MGHRARVWPVVAVLLAMLLTGMPGCRSEVSENAIQRFLDTSWRDYKATFITREGYVWDQARGEVTSEGQSYALLRAVWMHDRETFDRVLAWTMRHLSRPDGLLSWQWTPRDGGHILDANTATDAEQDIAFALILAARTFQTPAYREQARALLTAIRHHAAIMLPNGWVPCAGNWAVKQRVINFSYFTFYAYPFFAAVDPAGDWLGVRQRCYDLLTTFLSRPGVVLPADFARIDAAGDFLPVTDLKLSGDFSFDAMRVYWRVAMDCQLNQYPRACSDPAKSTAIVDILARQGQLYARYSVSGNQETDTTSVSFYGSVLPALQQVAPRLAASIVASVLSPKALTPLLRNSKHYYDNNWVWFGLAAYTGRIAREIRP